MSVDPQRNKILHGDNLPLLRKMPSESVQLIYIDPPFNTGKTQQRTRLKTVASADGDRTGFGGKRYQTEVVGQSGYADTFDDYLGFLTPRLREAHRVLTPNGSLFFHIDWRESARCRLLLEDIFGGDAHCINEIIWAYDYGARPKNNWAPKHDTIYWFAKDPNNYIFNYDLIERIPYMAPGLVGKEKAERGKTPTDVWWHTIVPTNSKEKTGYPTQKPVDLLRWIISVHSNVGDLVMDFFAGSGTCGAAAQALGRDFVLIDENKEAIKVMKKRINDDISVSNKKFKNDADESTITSIIDEKLNAKIEEMKKNYRPDRSQWFGSAYAWMREMPPASKGKLGRELASNILVSFSISVEKKGQKLKVNGKQLSARFSLLWESKVYKFEQIKNDVDGFCFLGVSPHKIHFWVVPVEEYHNFDKQHNPDSRWVEVNPANLKAKRIDWSQYGGELYKLEKTSFFQSLMEKE